MRVASPQFGAVNTAFLRVFFGCAGLLVILLIMRRTFRFDGKLKPALLLGVINSAFPFCTVWPRGGFAGRLLRHSQRHHAADGALIGFAFFAET